MKPFEKRNFKEIIQFGSTTISPMRQNPSLEKKTVTNEERDEVFDKCLSIKENKLCFDCGNSQPAWVSVYLGVYI